MALRIQHRHLNFARASSQYTIPPRRNLTGSCFYPKNLCLGRGLPRNSRFLSSGSRVPTFWRKRKIAIAQVTAGADVPFARKETPAKDGSVLTGDGSELQNTLRLVECAMLAATAGLAYFLSNMFRLEAYLGCFFPLPVVISSMRWGAAAGRKTMIATAMLLLVLSGPLKAASYLLMHGFVGLGMGSLWRWRFNWLLSIGVCTVVRSLGAVGFVLLSSWLLRENLLGLITINAHASFSYILAAAGINIIPSMMAIYIVFSVLVMINSGSFVFLLHVLKDTFQPVEPEHPISAQWVGRGHGFFIGMSSRGDEESGI
ncbi:hypothetical protein R1flu_018108 [Riccia fluitans]|uniref:DUF2232 domain-containing protein n=1 Tax=Riccia fluitans TaxID=41844 RepID=A0ABD1ZEW4_9MARC